MSDATLKARAACDGFEGDDLDSERDAVDVRPAVKTPIGGHVCEVANCQLSVVEKAWPFAARYEQEIEAHWQAEQAKNKGYFNGTVFALHAGDVRDRGLVGEVVSIEFKQFLYWREIAKTDQSIRDCFGSGILISSDGAAMLGRQMPGNINAGKSYFPGGFIDLRDVKDGAIDITGSVLRELVEETGLAASSLKPRNGHLVTTTGRQVSIGVILQHEQSAAELSKTIVSNIQSQQAAELEDVVFVRSPEDLRGLDVPDYTQCLVEHLYRTGQLKA